MLSPDNLRSERRSKFFTLITMRLILSLSFLLLANAFSSQSSDSQKWLHKRRIDTTYTKSILQKIDQKGQEIKQLNFAVPEERQRIIDNGNELVKLHNELPVDHASQVLERETDDLHEEVETFARENSRLQKRAVVEANASEDAKARLAKLRLRAQTLKTIGANIQARAAAENKQLPQSTQNSIQALDRRIAPKIEEIKIVTVTVEKPVVTVSTIVSAVTVEGKPVTVDSQTTHSCDTAIQVEVVTKNVTVGPETRTSTSKPTQTVETCFSNHKIKDQHIILVNGLKQKVCGNLIQQKEEQGKGWVQYAKHTCIPAAITTTVCGLAFTTASFVQPSPKSTPATVQVKEVVIGVPAKATPVIQQVNAVNKIQSGFLGVLISLLI